MKKRLDLSELAQAMQQHIAYRKNSDVVNVLWAGYLAALIVEGLISADEYHDLNGQLKGVGREELREILIGLPEPGDEDLYQ